MSSTWKPDFREDWVESALLRRKRVTLRIVEHNFFGVAHRQRIVRKVHRRGLSEYSGNGQDGDRYAQEVRVFRLAEWSLVTIRLPP